MGGAQGQRSQVRVIRETCGDAKDVWVTHLHSLAQVSVHRTDANLGHPAFSETWKTLPLAHAPQVSPSPRTRICPRLVSPFVRAQENLRCILRHAEWRGRLWVTIEFRKRRRAISKVLFQCLYPSAI